MFKDTSNATKLRMFTLTELSAGKYWVKLVYGLTYWQTGEEAEWSVIYIKEEMKLVRSPCASAAISVVFELIFHEQVVIVKGRDRKCWL